MNRYYYYLVFVCMASNIGVAIPRILLKESRTGAISSMILAIIVGTVLVYIITSFFNKFPGQGLPELMKKYTPKWLFYPVLFFFALIWFVAGLILVITYTFLIITFVSPETSIVTIVFSLVLIVSTGILIKTKSVLYTTEIILLLSSPLLIFLISKSLFNKELNWDYIRISTMYINKLPSYTSFASSLYIFLGAASLIIYNQVFTEKQKIGMKLLLFISMAGTLTLSITYFLPIGFGGFEKIDSLLYPWISTSDSMRMVYGPIDRVIYIFLMFFLAVAVISILVLWHISLKLFCSIFHFKRLKWKEKNLTPYFFAVIFGAIGIVLSRALTAYQLYQYSKVFYSLLPIAYVVLILSFVAVKRGVKSH